LERAGHNRAAAAISRRTRHAPKRGADEKHLRSYPKYFSRDGANHRAIRERLFFRKNAVALFLSPASATSPRTRSFLSRSGWPNRSQPPRFLQEESDRDDADDRGCLSSS